MSGRKNSSSKTTPEIEELLVTIGKLLADVDALEEQVRKLWSVIKWEGSALVTIGAAIVIYFWRNPDKWVSLVNFFK